MYVQIFINIRWCLILLSISLQALAQDTKAPVYKASACCNEWQSYVPDSAYPEFDHQKILKINYHYIFDGVRTLDTSFIKDFLYDITIQVNHRFNNNAKMTLPPGNNTEVYPINVQIQISPDPDIPGDDGIYFHTDPDYAIFNKITSDPNSMMSPKQYDKYGMGKGKVCNIFFLEHPIDSIASKTYKAFNNGVGTTHWVKIAGLQQYKLQYDGKYPDVKNQLAVSFSGQLAHELGHAMGLPHTWNGNDGCEDTPKNSNCFNLNFPDKPECDEPTEISNNLMDYNSNQTALTPCQLAKINYNFSAENKSYAQILRPDWCVYDSSASITIKPGDIAEWKGYKKIYGDLILGRKARLTLHCRYSLPAGARIILYPGAELIMKNATLFNSCGQRFGGFLFKGPRKKKGKIIMDGTSRILDADLPPENCVVRQ